MLWNLGERLAKHTGSHGWQIALVISLVLVFGLRMSLSAILIDPRADEGIRDIDYDGWWDLGTRVADYGSYTLRGEPTALRGPVPVLFFGLIYKLVGENRVLILGALWLLDTATAALMFVIADQVFGSKWVGVLAALAFAVYVPEFRVTTRAYSEPVATFVLAAAILALVKARQSASSGWFIAAGAGLGLAALARPVMIAFPAVCVLVFATWPWLRRNPIVFAMRAGLFIVATLLVLLPWIVRNYIAFGGLVPASTVGGFNLYIDHHRLGEADYADNRQCCGADKDFRYLDAASRTELASRGIDPTVWTEYQYDRFYYARALELIRRYPARFAHVCLLRVLRLWLNVGYGAPPSFASLLVMGANLSLLLLACTSYARFSGPWRGPAAILAVLLVYTTVMHGVMHAQVRYIFPFIPYALIIAAYATHQWFEFISRKRIFRPAARLEKRTI
jgi:4-amino-4-deoxy-L-arabinose transferase-like glycosyltransferase